MAVHTGFSSSGILSNDGFGSFGGYDFGGGGGYDFGNSFGDFGGANNFSSGAWDLGNSADWTSWQSEPSDYRSNIAEYRGDFGGGDSGGFGGGFGEAQGKTSNYQGTETPFNPNVGAPSWLKDILGVASVIPSPIQPIVALANVATNLYDANARGTSLVPSLSGIASLAGQPALAAGLGAYGQYEQGNTIGAGLTGLSALGIATGNPELGQIAGQIGSGLNAYNAAERGDYLTAALSATGAVDPSLAREANAANAINQGLQTGNMTAFLGGASVLAESPDLAIAAQASKLIDSAAKNDWGVVSDLASNIKQGTSDTIASLFQPGNITSIGGLFAPQGGFAPGELDREQMAVGPRDPVGYVPDPSLIGDYGGGSGGGSAAPSPAPSPVAAAPAQDNSGLMAMLLAMGLSEDQDQAPVAPQVFQAPQMAILPGQLPGQLGGQPTSLAELMALLNTRRA